MVRGIYIHNVSLQGGVLKKIHNQLEVFRQHYEMTEIVLQKEKTNFIKSILWRLPGGSYGMHYEEAIESLSAIEEPHFIYLRHQLLDRRYFRFLKTIRMLFPHAKVIMEFPAFPYTKENILNVPMLPFLIKDMWRRRHLKDVLDTVTTYSLDKDIFGINAIHILNGILIDGVVERNRKKQNDGELHLIAVALFQPAHGYERIIRGLHTYYQCGGNRRIIVHFVGDGPSLKGYKKLAVRLNLVESIIFHGFQNGDDLDAIYNESDIALGCFASYLQGIQLSSALKTREYLAKGLPVISGCTEDVFIGKEKEYYLEFPNNSTDIDFGKIVQFEENLCATKPLCDWNEEIREFAKENVDIHVTMDPILRYLK